MIEETTYKERLQDDYNRIRTQVKAKKLPQPARNQAIDEAVSAYVLAQDTEFERKGDRAPIAFRDANMLDRFANLVLHEDLTWSHPDKMSIVEYPVMSDAQECRRERKYRPSDNVYYDSGQFSGRKTGYDMGEDGELGKKTSSPVFSPIHNEEINRKDVSIDVLTLLDDAGLTTRQREAVELVYFEGLTQEQAADRMGIHKANVNAYVGFALDKLRVVT